MSLSKINEILSKIETVAGVLKEVTEMVKPLLDQIAPETPEDKDGGDQPSPGGDPDKDPPVKVQGESRVIVRHVEQDPTKVHDAEFREVIEDKTPRDTDTFPCPVCGTNNVATINPKDPDDTLERARDRVTCRRCCIFLGDPKQVEKGKNAMAAGLGPGSRPEGAKKHEGF